MKTKNGFTLIELMVVIAILGIFAVIVLVALGTTRNRGSAASIKSQMTSIKNQAEIYYVSNNYNYGSTWNTGNDADCPTNGALGTVGTIFTTQTNKGIGTLVDAVIKNSGQASLTHCGSNGLAWAVAATLPGGGFWCVDSVGISRDNVSGVSYSSLSSAPGGGGAFNTTSKNSCN